MRVNYEINKNIIWVRGEKNSALYNFNDNKVYSIDYEGTQVLSEYIINKNNVDSDFLLLLSKQGFLSPHFKIHDYIPENKSDVKLEMAWLELTQKCNLKCIHCYEGEKHVQMDEHLSTSEWCNIIDQLAAEKVKRIILIGGEPCCYKGISHIIDYISKYNIDVTLFTNLTLLNDAIFDAVVKNKIRVKVSIYGHNPEVHEKITKISGSFNLLVNNVKKLLDNGIDVSPSIIIMKENEAHLEDIKSFIRSIGLKYNGHDIIRSVFGGTQNKHTPELESTISRFYYQKPNFRITKEYFDNNCYRNSCWYGKIAIQENGKVLPCVFERLIEIGDLRKQTIRELLSSEEIKKTWFYTFDNVQQCKDCEFRYACKDCRALALASNRIINNKNPKCLYNPYSGKWGDVDYNE